MAVDGDLANKFLEKELLTIIEVSSSLQVWLLTAVLETEKLDSRLLTGLEAEVGLGG